MAIKRKRETRDVTVRGLTIRQLRLVRSRYERDTGKRGKMRSGMGPAIVHAIRDWLAHGLDREQPDGN